jgi:hypothetical protein
LAADRQRSRRAAAKRTFSGTPLDAELTTALGGEFSAAGTLLTLPDVAPRTQAALRQALTALLDAARSSTASTPERHALLLMAADRLAARVGETTRDAPGWEQEQRRFASYGLTFEWAPLGSTWLYTHDLLWRVWKEHPDTRWGRQAFVELLSSGWHTTVGCRPNPGDSFRDVIVNGEGYLRRRPRTPERAQIVLMLAQSYETWWSLSRAGEERGLDIPDPEVYQQGAATARDKAIAYYNELLRLSPTMDEAGYARIALPRLKLNIDTGQRRFLCFYD